MGKIRKSLLVGKGHIAEPEDIGTSDDAFPEFSLTYVRKGFDVRDCTQEDRAHLAATLSDLSKRTWKELKTLHRHKGGFEIIRQLAPELPEKWQGALPIAFRFSGMKPVIGVRDRQVFHIIWIDPAMKKYRH